MCFFVIIWEDGTAVDQKETTENKKWLEAVVDFSFFYYSASQKINNLYKH